MKIIRNIMVAFALYSRIPMPIFEWKEEDMKYTIAFLPLIGLVIGGVEYLAMKLAVTCGLPMIARIVIYILIPLMITGGFHVDGFLDVQDAMKSYKSKEEKLQILKDPHIGAFAVIGLMTYACFYILALAIILDSENNLNLMGQLSVSFFEIRALTAVLSMVCTPAKNDGMLYEETRNANKLTLTISLIELMLGGIVMFVMGATSFVCMAVVVLLFAFYYNASMKRQFGGVTGDTAGYFVLMGELLVMLSASVMVLIS